MKQIHFTVGPTQLYPTVPKHIQTAIDSGVLSMSHRSTVFQKLYSSLTTNLRSLLSIPATHQIFFVASGTEAMERIIENVVIKDSFHFVNGAFSDRFYKTALELGKKPQQIKANSGESFDFTNVEIPKESEVVCFTHNETSTGVMLPLPEIYGILERYPRKLIALDIVSSAPYVDIDYRKVDIAFFSVQKGFGLPSGLGVMIANPQAYSKAQFMNRNNISTGSYHSFIELKKYASKNQTPETPNVLGMYLLNKVAQDMLKKGISKIREEIEQKSNVLEQAIENSTYSYLVSNTTVRSKTIHVVQVPEGSKKCISKLLKKGIHISSGYKDLEENYIRISNFPAHSKKEVEILLKELA